MTYTLLCVDDDSQKLNTITALLKREGYEVITAPVGAEALKLFAEKHIDLAVVDHYMPGMSGDVLAAVHREGEVITEAQTEGGTKIRARLGPVGVSRFADFTVTA